MQKYGKAIIIVIVSTVVLFIVCGISFNLIFRHISYSFYTNAKLSQKTDGNIRKIVIRGDKKLAGYARSADFSVPKKTILYFGGSGEIAYNAMIEYGDIFKDYALVSVDYPGCQESQGSMSLATMQDAAVKLYDYVSSQSYVDKAHIYIVGYSYGTGLATYLASQRDCAGLVLVAPYRDVIDLYNAIIPVFHSPLGWFVTDNIDSKKYAKNVKAKTLIVTSTADTTIKHAIPESLAGYFADAKVAEFAGIEHLGYWSNHDVKSVVLSFCE